MANPGIELAGGATLVTAAGGGLGYALSHWELAVQAGAVGVAVVLAWVVWQLWNDNKASQKKMEDLYAKWIEAQKLEANEEKKFTQSFVEELTKARQTREESHKIQQEMIRRLEDLERSCRGKCSPSS